MVAVRATLCVDQAGDKTPVDPGCLVELLVSQIQLELAFLDPSADLHGDRAPVDRIPQRLPALRHERHRAKPPQRAATAGAALTQLVTLWHLGEPWPIHSHVTLRPRS